MVVQLVERLLLTAQACGLNPFNHSVMNIYIIIAIYKKASKWKEELANGP